MGLGVHTGYEVFSLTAFALLVYVAIRAVRYSYVKEAGNPPMAGKPARSRLRVKVDLRDFLVWLLENPAVALLLVLGALIGFYQPARGYGLESWIYPEGDVERFVASALIMLLVCEAILLGYLLTCIDYHPSAWSRYRCGHTILRTYRMLRSHGLLRRALRSIHQIVGLAPPGAQVVLHRELGLSYLDVLDRPERPVDLDDVRSQLMGMPVRRLRAAPAVVLTQGLVLLVMIASLVAIVVIGDNLDRRDQTRLMLWVAFHIVVSLLGLAVGLVASWWVTRVCVIWATSHAEDAPQARQATLTRKAVVDAIHKVRAARRRSLTVEARWTKAEKALNQAIGGLGEPAARVAFVNAAWAEVRAASVLVRREKQLEQMEAKAADAWKAWDDVANDRAAFLRGRPLGGPKPDPRGWPLRIALPWLVYLLYVGAVVAWPANQPAFLLLLVAYLIYELPSRWSGRPVWSNLTLKEFGRWLLNGPEDRTMPDDLGPRAFGIGLLLIFLLANALVLPLLRLLGASESWVAVAPLIGCVSCVLWTLLFLWRTSRRDPALRIRNDSVIAVPALILLGFVAVCLVYQAASTIEWLWDSPVAWPFQRVVAVPLAFLAGAVMALVFLLVSLWRWRLWLGLLGALLVTSYMDGMAVDRSVRDDAALDRPGPGHKLSFSGLDRAYGDRRVRLDTRDYFTSAYERVVPLEDPSRRDPRQGERIGVGAFRAQGKDLFVRVPTHAVRPDWFDKQLGAQDKAILRMPRRVRIERVAAGTPGDPTFVIRGVDRDSLQNAALLWKIGEGGRPKASYTVFPLRHRPEQETQVPAPDWRDQSPYWDYWEIASEDPGPPAGVVANDRPRDWYVKVPANADDPKIQADSGRRELFLIGNWPFEVARPTSPPGTPESITWLRLKGAAEDGYFHDPWGQLGLDRPEDWHRGQDTDIEPTFMAPHPWGTYEVLAQFPADPSDPAGPGVAWWRLRLSVANQWLGLRAGDQIRPRPGGDLDGDAYWVVDPGRLEPPPRGGSTWSQDGVIVASVKGAVMTPEVDGQISSHRIPDRSEAAAQVRLSRRPNRWEIQWEGGGSGRTLLIDRVESLTNWKTTLDEARRVARDPHRCDCPVVEHAEDCPARVEAGECAGRSCEVRHKLVLVTVSGGGIRSAVWVATVLARLEQWMGPMFPYHVRLISGASGGMLGASYYAATLQDPITARLASSSPIPHHVRDRGDQGQTLQAHEIRDHLAGQDFLSPTVSRLVFGDLLGSLTTPFALRRDRGEALEEAWCSMSVPARIALGRPFRDYAAGERAGWLPSLVFSPMLPEDGRRLLVSNLDLSPAPRNFGSMLLEPSSSHSRSQFNQLGTFVAGGPQPGVELYSMTAVEFFRLFPEADALTLATAIRMSATFPVISPAVTLPTRPPRSVVDAGYYDNFGVNLVALWATSDVRAWLRDNTSGVVIVQIRDHASQVLRTEVDHDDHAPTDDRSDRARSVIGRLTGDFWDAAWNRGRLQFKRPLDGIFNARYSVTSFRNDEQIEDLSGFFQNVPPTREELKRAAREALESPSGSGDWADDVGEAIDRVFDPERRQFPFTTVVFECPIEAALSWDLTRYDADNIILGMGPREFLPPDEDDLLVYRKTQGLKAGVQEAYTKHRTRTDGGLAGDLLTATVDGVVHNLQRLTMLRRWWREAKPIEPEPVPEVFHARY